VSYIDPSTSLWHQREQAIAEVERIRGELDEATKRAHEHRLAFDWMVVELVPDASADDIEQLWQEAHAALKP
jgi:hypothetical protein